MESVMQCDINFQCDSSCGSKVKLSHSSKTFDWFLCCLMYLLGISFTYNIYILFWPTCIVARMAVVNNCTLSPRPPAITHQTAPEYSLRIKVEWKGPTSARTGICFTFLSFFRSLSMKMYTNQFNSLPCKSHKVLSVTSKQASHNPWLHDQHDQ